MNKPNHICKNPDCGVAYYWCDGCNVSKDVEWGRVGCCLECAQIYWDLIEKSRNKLVVEEEVKPVAEDEVVLEQIAKPKRKSKQEETITEE